MRDANKNKAKYDPDTGDVIAYIDGKWRKITWELFTNTTHAMMEREEEKFEGRSGATDRWNKVYDVEIPENLKGRYKGRWKVVDLAIETAKIRNGVHMNTRQAMKATDIPIH